MRVSMRGRFDSAANALASGAAFAFSSGFGGVA
jgi:hypothetical protein